MLFESWQKWANGFHLNNHYKDFSNIDGSGDSVTVDV